VLVLAGLIGVVPGLRPDVEAQVYGTTPIPPALVAQPVRPIVEAIPAAPAGGSAPVTAAAPAPPAGPAPPAVPAPTPAAPEPSALPPATGSTPAPVVDALPRPAHDVQPLGAPPVAPAAAAVQGAAQSTTPVQVRALPTVGTGGPRAADAPLQPWMLGSLVVVLGSVVLVVRSRRCGSVGTS
jgi:hypothetical protein